MVRGANFNEPISLTGFHAHNFKHYEEKMSKGLNEKAPLATAPERMRELFDDEGERPDGFASTDTYL